MAPRAVGKTIDVDDDRWELYDVTKDSSEANVPSAQDVRLFAARFDAVDPCREDLLRAVAIPRSDLVPVLVDEFKATGAISGLVVERQVTWAEAARRAQVLLSDVRQKVAATDPEWTADIIPFHQPDMAQVRAAAARSQ